MPPLGSGSGKTETEGRKRWGMMCNNGHKPGTLVSQLLNHQGTSLFPFFLKKYLHSTRIHTCVQYSVVILKNTRKYQNGTLYDKIILNE